MAKSSLTRLFATRLARVTTLCAILIALAAISLSLGRGSLALSLVIPAIAIATAFFAFVIRPARIPRDAIVTVRFSGVLPEEPHRSLIDQLRGRVMPALSHL